MFFSKRTNLIYYSCEFVRQYSMIYIKNRTDTVEALETLPQLKHAHHLKAKILFSIIVVSIRNFSNK